MGTISEHGLRRPKNGVLSRILCAFEKTKQESYDQLFFKKHSFINPILPGSTSSKKNTVLEAPRDETYTYKLVHLSTLIRKTI